MQVNNYKRISLFVLMISRVKRWQKLPTSHVKEKSLFCGHIYFLLDEVNKFSALIRALCSLH